MIRKVWTLLTRKISEPKPVDPELIQAQLRLDAYGERVRRIEALRAKENVIRRGR